MCNVSREDFWRPKLSSFINACAHQNHFILLPLASLELSTFCLHFLSQTICLSIFITSTVLRLSLTFPFTSVLFAYVSLNVSLCLVLLCPSPFFPSALDALSSLYFLSVPLHVSPCRTISLCLSVHWLSRPVTHIYTHPPPHTNYHFSLSLPPYPSLSLRLSRLFPSHRHPTPTHSRTHLFSLSLTRFYSRDPLRPTPYQTGDA